MEKTKKIFIFALVLGVLSLGIGMASVSLFIRESKELFSAKEELGLRQSQKEAEFSMKKLLSETEEERENIDNYFIKTDDIVSFIESIESLSRVTNTSISVNSVSIEEGKETDVFEYVVLNVEAQGVFSDLYWLLSLVEKMPYKISVNTINFGRLPSGESTSPSDRWNIDFSIRVLKLN